MLIYDNNKSILIITIKVKHAIFYQTSLTLVEVALAHGVLRINPAFMSQVFR